MKTIRSIRDLGQAAVDMVTKVQETTDEGSGIDHKIREALSVMIWSTTAPAIEVGPHPLEWQRFAWEVERGPMGARIRNLTYENFARSHYVEFPDLFLPDYLIAQLMPVDEAFAHEQAFGHAGHLIIDAFTGDPAAQRLLNRLVGEQVI